MRILVTGGAGFIGSHLIDHLVAQEHQVIALDDLSSGSESNLAHHRGNPNVDLVVGSILDQPLVDRLSSQCGQVFHLAASVGVRMITEDPLRSLEVNLRGTETVLGSCAERHMPFLLASTSEVYGKNSDVPLTEDSDRVLGSPWMSRWSYSEAKAIDEFIAYCAWQAGRLPLVIVRLFNTVGPRQTGHYGMVLPSFVQLALRNAPLQVFGDGQQTRCFCDVRDVVPAIVALTVAPEAQGKAVNLGGAEEVSIEALAERVIQLTHSGSQVEFVSYEDAYRPGFDDVRRRVPDTGLARRLVGFNPRISLDESILSIAEEGRTVQQDREVGRGESQR